MKRRAGNFYQHEKTGDLFILADVTSIYDASYFFMLISLGGQVPGCGFFDRVEVSKRWEVNEEEWSLITNGEKFIPVNAPRIVLEK